MKLAVLGGFLGAGKTSLILAASRVLRSRGLRAAAILNDQGAELVDTRRVGSSGMAADEVTGGCFCCRFPELIAAAERLLAWSPDVIFAEAVGSCTDIAATVLHPLQREYAGRYGLAPFTVLVDPARAHELLAPGADPDLSFLFCSQVAEADLVCFTKADLGAAAPPLSGARTLSAKTGEGVAAWLDEILGAAVGRGKALDIDYARYARAEASLAWLNTRVRLVARPAASPALVTGPLLDTLDSMLTRAGIRIAHLKLFDECPAGAIRAGLCANGEQPQVEGALDASPAAEHEILVNLRASGDPARIGPIVEAALAALPGDVRVESFQCFRPSAPQPARKGAGR